MDDMIPHKSAVKIVEKLVSPLSLKASKSAWGRELKVFKKITESGRYNDSDFWTELDFPAYFDSMSYFLADYGAAVLEEKWRYFQLSKAYSSQKSSAEEKNSLDFDSQSQIIGDSQEKPARKMTMLSWTDTKSD